MIRLQVILVITTTCLLTTANTGVPIATAGPSIINEGKDALLTCVVSENRKNNTVIWKRNENEVLTAGMLRVSSDQRISVLHDENPKIHEEIGSEVWVLLIKNLKTSDSGSYMCELNSEPALRSIQILSVISKDAASKYNGEDASNVTDSTSFLVPPPLDGNENRSFWRASSIAPQITHDFTDCCERANISAECMGFCNVHNILDGTTGIEPESCEKEFPNIVRCMADGRNHAPCCIEKKIPDLCQDMCRGEYTPFTDQLRTRVSCVQHTLNGLQCILDGVQKIPSAPQDINVDTVTETSLHLSWSPPEKLAHKVHHYTINVTALHSFDDDSVAAALKMNANSGISQLKRLQERTILQSVSSNQTQLLLQQLKPLTMYSIYVLAVNEFGTSLPSERLRIFTHTNEYEDNVTKNSTTSKKHDVGVPNLPDIRSCCEMNGMTHRLCLDKMCDPQKTDLATLPDFMVCAPWSNITFNCLANNIDHTPCCRSRGIPAACFPLCSGSITSLNFSLFKCLRFMSEYSSCLFQGYGVLASAPTKLRTIAKTDKFVILNWNMPKVLADTVMTYHIKFRHLGVGDDYLTLEKKSPPLIMEGLEPEVYYEFYVVAVNTYGKSEPSSRLIIRTLPSEIIEEPKRKYNMTTCCQASGLLPQCAPLCNYNIRMSDIERLGPACRAQMSVIARCAAGGRDHTSCCQRRGVVATCLSLCRGVMPTSSATNDCLSYAGNILQCFEEGTENIPGPVRNMHVTAVTNTSISLTWSQPEFEGDDTSNATAIVTNFKSDVFNTTTTTTTTTTNNNNNNNKNKNSSTSSSNGDNGSSLLITSTPMTLATVSNNSDTWGYGYENVDDNDIDFIVQYGKVNNMTMYETVAKLENELTTIQTSIVLTKLEPHALYRIMVVTRGKYGTSLPSSMLLINTTAQQEKTTKNDTTVNNGNNFDIVTENHHTIHGAPSPPHSLTIVAQSATWMQLTWQPPEFSYPHEKILYRIYHKPMKSEKFNKIETKVAWLRLSNLKPSSQHILYVEAIGEKATSLPSETLVAWTDPALPAFVDPPTVHPADNISEGGSMTILCLALGNPAPTISLYVGGHLVRQDTSRHMITVIHNVSASMEHVSCYADNGYGVPMQATRRVNICYPPKIQASGITVASVGDEVELRCIVDAKPIPKTIFWRDHDGRVPVVQGGNYDISMKTNDTKSTLYTMILKINKLQATDVGDYFCHAENPFGTSTIPVSVRIRNTPNLHRNVSQCCAESNVTMACRSACSYYVDFDAIADRPACIGDFDKLMSCAADGSDHRPCCADANVPRKCLNWCRGEPVRSKEICSLQYSRIIIGCFESNRDRLPGPPENIAVNVVSDTQVVIRWDPPSKNPNVVDGYRVFYHETILPMEVSSTTMASSNSAEILPVNPTNNTPEIQRIDVKETSVTIENLKKDVLYELVVKAGNNHGASVLTDPIKFTLGEHHVTSATTYSQTVGTISGILASILAILLAAVSIIFWRRHRAGHKSSGNGVAFENPTYSCNLEQVQLPTVTSNMTTTTTTTTPPASVTTTASRDGGRGGGGMGVGLSNDGVDFISSSAAVISTSQQEQKQQSKKGYQQHQNNTSQYNEINPSIYQELKLGQAGAGYRELVP